MVKIPFSDTVEPCQRRASTMREVLHEISYMNLNERLVWFEYIVKLKLARTLLQ